MSHQLTHEVLKTLSTNLAIVAEYQHEAAEEIFFSPVCETSKSSIVNLHMHIQASTEIKKYILIINHNNYASK